MYLCSGRFTRGSFTDCSMTNVKLIRLIICCLVIVAMVKFFFRPREYKTTNAKTHDIVQAVNFWASDGARKVVEPQEDTIKKENQDNQDVKPQVVGNQEQEKVEDVLDGVMTDPLKIVHLDLKGAAPKVTYLAQVPEDIEEIKSLATQHKLQLIPLVQAFGHMEFVLKHEKFFKLREVDTFPNSLNSLAPGSIELVQEMLTQVMKKHPEARWFHIGADEVRGLGESEDSKRWLEAHSGDMGKLFLNHVTAVSTFMKKLNKGVKLILWDDMFRRLGADTIKDSGLQDFASLMIWKYTPNMDVKEIGNLISKYEEAGFKGIWFASAFKGASGIDQLWTPILHHLKNHEQWHKVIASMPEYKSIKYLGIALTGWQRYEHHTVLCELFPVAIPSLAVCLQTLKHGQFEIEAQNEVQRFLGCEIDLSASDWGSFPGSDIYEMVKKIGNSLGRSVDKIMNSYHIRGSFSVYNRKRNFANPRNLGFFQEDLKKLMDEWDNFLMMFRERMEMIFYPDTLEEWMEENVNQHIERLHEMVVDVDRIIVLKGQPKLV
ncbi:hypothetical protein DNTS_003916 [Danionella cerebrum]|uniref:Beta-N-acetylhexosaminidase n=1 Tax=Danionella cerebrum TaxID=2873325 RepID=A0A553Q429_9TELE|nr:hypothetical protein DNTS_003916 [Danionella translucida]